MIESMVSDNALPVGSKGQHASGWWGMLALVFTEGALFAYLFFSYFYLALHAISQWPPGGPPHLSIAVPGTLILVAAGVVVWWGERGIQRGNRRRLMIGLSSAMLLGLVFLGMQGVEWHNKAFGLSASVYSSLYFTITGTHMLHVMVGLLMIGVLLVWTALGYFGGGRHAAVSIGVIYWHFVTIVWLVVFFVIYIAPRLG
jgi:heme/copper-type cytochrome/quinol oxidase subunit 3